jgi:magnesium chelatase family protein
MTDLAAIRGQEHAKRAIEVAACGGHSLLLTGGPGHGKTFLTEALLDLERSLFSVTPQEDRPVLQGYEALAWVGMALRGERGALGQVRHGLLVLDRLDCFGFSAIQIQRLGVVLDQALDVQVVVTCQPCFCGWYDDPLHMCVCSSRLIERHWRRLRALIERIPMEMHIPRRDYEVFMDRRVPESSAKVARRVQEGRERQQARFAGLAVRCNAGMDYDHLLQFCPLEASADRLFKAAYQQLSLSERRAAGILAVARTIADLAESEQIQANHLAEAISYQPTHVS